MKLSTFISLILTAIVVITALEFSIYANKQAVIETLAEPVTDTIDTELPLVSIDTLPVGIFIITAKNDIGETINITINTANYQSNDNAIDEIGNSSTAWTGDESDKYMIKTNNSVITYIVKDNGDNTVWSDWYKVVSILYEIK